MHLFENAQYVLVLFTLAKIHLNLMAEKIQSISIRCVCVCTHTHTDSVGKLILLPLKDAKLKTDYK